ncbi:MAG: FixH family protein [Alphaproteobacteria bacterium]|nr:FixH family protein [Alphaproteobacteria bacterium]
MTDYEPHPEKKDGKRVLIYLLAFFVVFASVDAFFFYKALTTNTGTVSDNAYEQGLRFNDIINEAEKRLENAP